jgi:hypothetical protein
MSRTEPIQSAASPAGGGHRRANEPCPSLAQSPCHRIPGPLAGRKDPMGPSLYPRWRKTAGSDRIALNGVEATEDPEIIRYPAIGTNAAD